MSRHLSNKIYVYFLETNINYCLIACLRSLFIHGFVVDENGRKMSKSIGNVIDPQDIVNGNYDKSISGIDILR